MAQFLAMATIRMFLDQTLKVRTDFKSEKDSKSPILTSVRPSSPEGICAEVRQNVRQSDCKKTKTINLILVLKSQDTYDSPRKIVS